MRLPFSPVPIEIPLPLVLPPGLIARLAPLPPLAILSFPVSLPLTSSNTATATAAIADAVAIVPSTGRMRRAQG